MPTSAAAPGNFSLLAAESADSCSSLGSCLPSAYATSCPPFGDGAGDAWDSVKVYSGSGDFDSRYGHAVVNFFGDYLVIGGIDLDRRRDGGGDGLSDVWKLTLSPSGPDAALTRISPDGGFLGRGMFASVAHTDGRVYIFGGSTGGSGTASDAWRSGDGISWEAVESPSNKPRINSVALTSAARIFIFGGADTDCDISVSSPGNTAVSWSIANLSAGTPEVCGASGGAVSGTKMFVYNFRSSSPGSIYGQVFEWNAQSNRLVVVKARWTIQLGGIATSSSFAGAGSVVVAGESIYIVGQR